MARFAHYAALIPAFGAFAYASYGNQSATVSRHLRRLAVGSALLVLVGALAVLAATVAGLGGSLASLSDPTLWSAILGETDFGRVWSVRLLMVLVLIGISWAMWLRPARLLCRAGLLVAGALLATIALTGHAQTGDGANGSVHRIADAAHLLAAAVWLGALPPLLILMSRGADGSVHDPAQIADLLKKFHSIGLASVVVLVLTGVMNSWFLFESFGQLVSTTYGGILLAKLALFAVMVALAADNRLRNVPELSQAFAKRSDTSAALTRLRSRVRAELALGILLLLAVAILGASAPPAA